MFALVQVATSHPAPFPPLRALWPYIALGSSGIITEEAAPLIGGLAAHDGHLDLIAVGLWIAVGTWVAALGLYYVGRVRGQWARQRFPRLRTFMLGALRIVRRHPWRSSLAVRWAYGLRLTLPIACGAARLPLPVYMIGSAISCLSWAAVFTLLGWAFGRTAMIVVGHVRRYENYLIAIIVLVLALVFLLMRRQHVEDEVVEVLAKGDTGPIPKLSRPEDL